MEIGFGMAHHAKWRYLDEPCCSRMGWFWESCWAGWAFRITYKLVHHVFAQEWHVRQYVWAPKFIPELGVNTGNLGYSSLHDTYMIAVWFPHDSKSGYKLVSQGFRVDSLLRNVVLTQDGDIYKHIIPNPMVRRFGIVACYCVSIVSCNTGASHDDASTAPWFTGKSAGSYTGSIRFLWCENTPASFVLVGTFFCPIPVFISVRCTNTLSSIIFLRCSIQKSHATPKNIEKKLYSILIQVKFGID